MIIFLIIWLTVGLITSGLVYFDYIRSVGNIITDEHYLGLFLLLFMWPIYWIILFCYFMDIFDKK